MSIAAFVLIASGLVLGFLDPAVGTVVVAVGVLIGLVQARAVARSRPRGRRHDA